MRKYLSVILLVVFAAHVSAQSEPQKDITYRYNGRLLWLRPLPNPLPEPQENIPVGWVSCTQATPCASSATTFYTTTVTTLYRLSASVSCTTTTAAATAILIVKYTDPSNTVQTLTLATATCTTLGAASIANTLQPLNILTGTAVQYSVTVVNAPSYQARVSLVREGLN